MTTVTAPVWTTCRLCGVGLLRASARGAENRGVCAGCAERLEWELTASERAACPDCGRHRELCAVMPCGGPAPEPARQSAPPPTIAWVAIADIDETPAELNSRQVYDTRSVIELAASIKEHGVLQPLCVRPAGRRFILVFGLRRLRAARRAGMSTVPCMIQPAADDRAFLLNVIENLHRRQLSGAERVRAIERLAATHLGVRELGRRTGLAPSTISRWLKIHRCPALKQALESDALDIGRAKLLADAPPAALPELIVAAPLLNRAELAQRVAALRATPATAEPSSASDDTRRLLGAVRLIESVRQMSPADRPILNHLQHEVERLLSA
jgi:ParB family chromosome partitioning protein